ncbi:hypothetical protein CJD36_000435 [Flavipsychrobacter stenotrophus]|uniref:DUF2520 domain-containing protein n=1 Tax=Flavipsychrobacter stenotrophus TaxID=2077091 RepID=A0A2S7SZ86_9BACT|nr:Rossmann-like and DUF2520 domain-containing protein [Flavipsychrobacter stenotrophus]PQJ12259.1 hypothetical protein CJD36_000435 [Flavipsychrobacter stenotrophus]
MTFSIIGSGNIAWFFGKRLAAGGHQCKGVYGRNATAVKELADGLLSNRFGAINEVRDEDADVCFLAVSDASIEEVAKQLHFKKTILVHMSGAQPLDIIKDAAKDHAVLWPVYSILKNNTPGHREIPIAWEVSSDRAKRFVLEMGHAITDNLFEAKDAKRKWLHLSAVMTNNFINHLLAINEQICKENNLPASTLQPMIAQTFERVKSASPKAVQTGPAIRQDITTIEQHKVLLADHPELLKVYEALTESIQAMHHPKALS